MNQPIQVQITPEDVLNKMKAMTGKEDFSSMEKAMVELFMLTQQAISFVVMEKQQTASILQGLNGGKLK